jgi:chromosome segregation ATPase
MTGRQPNPRDVRRLATLEADLKAQREAAEDLIKERAALTARVAELEGKLKAADSAQDGQAKANESLIKLLERVFKTHGIPPPAARGLPAFVEALATHLNSLLARTEQAEKQVADLESQLAAAGEALKEAARKFRDLKAEVDAREAEHKAQVTALSAELAAAQDALEDLRKAGTAIEPLLAENQRLAAQIDSTAAEMAALRDAARSASVDIKAARTEAEASVRAEVSAEIKRLTSAQTTLQKQLDTANAQLAQEGKTPILPAERVAGLLNDLVAGFQSNFTGLQIREGELSLKVGFGAAGEVGGFVIPTTDSTPELRENLQEIKLRFDRDLLTR